MARPLWIESFDYFSADNRFCGSDGPFSFKIIPEEFDKKTRAAKDLLAIVWFGPNCCEKTPDEEKTSCRFAFSADGLDEAVRWIEARRSAGTGGEGAAHAD